MPIPIVYVPYLYTFVHVYALFLTWFFLNPSQEDSRWLGTLSGSAGFVTGCFMVHHDVVRISCTTSVKAVCQSILHSLDSKYFICHHLRKCYEIWFIVLWFSTWTLEEKFYFTNYKFWSVCQFINFWSFFFTGTCTFLISKNKNLCLGVFNILFLFSSWPCQFSSSFCCCW